MQEMFYRDTWVEIDLDNIAENVRQTKKLLPENVQMIAVVKANGYGHGDVQVAETALAEGASYLAVAFLDEALALREKGITAPILVLGASRPEDVNIASKNQITLTVFQEEWLQKAKGFLDKDLNITVHLKIDSGMGRIGVRSREELRAVESLIKEDNRFQLEGAFTHFATADEMDRSYFQQQLDRFNEMLSFLTSKPKLIHASNSAATLRKLSPFFNGIRLGISMYGLTPSLEIEKELPFPLKEAFTLRTKVIHVKKLHPGDKVSYGATYEASEEEWIGTLPIGYADGWIRRLQGQEVLVDGMRTPIVGRICMDQCMIRLPYKVEVGTIVTLIGKDGSEGISINEIASKLDTINYEIPCIISNRVPRVYKKSGETVAMKNLLLDVKC
jgi:alanine racemase